MPSDQLAHMRRDYIKEGLLETHAPADPFELFGLWLKHAVLTEQLPVEPNAMMLATVDARGQPHCRMMLLKGMDEQGFVFYTNYASAKGQELANSAQAAMTFYWPALERQVRIEGRVEQVSAAESDAYYQVRPLGSRLGAWASPQSSVIEDRHALEDKLQQVHERFHNNDNPPRPEHWGGYRLLPERIEFWQGRTCRLHDRLNYRLQDDKQWLRERLAP